ncbi:MAG TPA: hypothetical protein VKC56_05585 [Gallionellaceae bacterium]|nr:hypothetical protein [Gallionellaceae bacterium]
MRYRKLFYACLASVTLLSGCASSSPPRDLDDPTNSLYFGHIDMSDAPGGVNAADVEQIAPPTKFPYWKPGLRKGLFCLAILPPGSYQVTDFSGGDMVYDFPRQGNPTSVRIRKPGIYFVGSYKYVPVKTGFFEGAKFAIKRVNKPTEAELLRRILEYPDIQKSAWKKKIEARLAHLRQ